MKTGHASVGRAGSPSHARACRILETMKIRWSATTLTTGMSTLPQPRWASRLAALLCLSAILLTCCAQPQLAATPAPVVLHLAGSTSMQPLLHDLAAGYSARYPQVSFDFAAMGSTAGLEALRRGNADLALVSRELQPDEQYDALTNKRLLAYDSIAQDAIAVIVNEKNPLRTVSLYDLRKVFAGQILSWDELGGSGQIGVVSREDGSATRMVFEETVMQGHAVTPAAVVMPGSQAVRDYVAAHEGTIGYVSIGYLGAGVAALAIEGVQPKRETIDDGSYPLTRPFLLVSLPDPSSTAIAFVQFARSAAGQAIVKRTYGLRRPPK
jgi:phosphate transport system substrate-binding protein